MWMHERCTIEKIRIEADTFQPWRDYFVDKHKMWDVYIEDVICSTLEGKKLKIENIMLSEYALCSCGSLSPARNDILLIWLLTLYFKQRADNGWLANKNIIIYKWGVPAITLEFATKLGKWSVSQVHIARADMAEQPDKRET